MLAAMLLTAVLGAEPTEEFKIEEFVFSWTVDRVGENSLSVMKDDNSIYVRVRDIEDGISLTPTEAVAVAEALKRTDEWWKKMLGSPVGTEERIEISEELQVVFLKNKSGFFASLESENTKSFVLIDRKAANRFAPHLAKAKEMAKFVDERVKP